MSKWDIVTTSAFLCLLWSAGALEQKALPEWVCVVMMGAALAVVGWAIHKTNMEDKEA